MSIEKRSLEVLRAGLDDTLNLMDEEAMDMIEGGRCLIFTCATYNDNSTPAPTTPQVTPTPTNPPTPTCDCGTICPCKVCGCTKS